MIYADMEQRIAELNRAAAICEEHVISAPVNGVYSSYPRWPEAWRACEVVWRAYLDARVIRSQQDLDDRRTVIDEARRLR